MNGIVSYGEQFQTILTQLNQHVGHLLKTEAERSEGARPQIKKAITTIANYIKQYQKSFAQLTNYVKNLNTPENLKEPGVGLIELEFIEQGVASLLEFGLRVSKAEDEVGGVQKSKL